ncbi:MAG: peptidoglycan bridge formation glycyltransferase FemA/FemB family protein, partial [Anaerolineae bacterium]|nr:peptidoglycan bridge formation glycyltransferase FemA/FemB family protein [Anaerolineae bacterium]
VMVNTTFSPLETAWDAFVAGHPYGHILQTSRWARLKSAFGWGALFVPFRSGPALKEPLLGGSSLLLRRLPWGGTLAYVPRGPVVDWSRPDHVSALFVVLREACLKRRIGIVKIEPELPDTPEVAALLSAAGFRRSPQRIQPLSTIHIDLTGDEEAILGRMKQKWRYNIRLAERKGVTVRHGTAADLPAIQRLMEATAARDRFGVHNLAYHAAATELFAPADMMTWLIAEHEGRLLAAIAVFALGRMAWYMWGASADEDRNLMPNHALQWAAMRWARARGCTRYDLWGIPDEVGTDPAAYADPASWGNGGLWGVYRFKQGFGGQVVRYTGAWDLPLSPLDDLLYRLAVRARQRMGNG